MALVPGSSSLMNTGMTGLPVWTAPAKCRVVRQPQVVAEPGQNGLHPTPRRSCRPGPLRPEPETAGAEAWRPARPMGIASGTGSCNEEESPQVRLRKALRAVQWLP